MASGVIDWFRGVNVTYQALAQLIVRPKYGAAQLVTFADKADKNDTTVLADIAGQGLLYGAHIIAKGSDECNSDNTGLIVDGEVFDDQPFKSMYAYGEFNDVSAFGGLACYDPELFVYTRIFGHGMTFESSLEFHYTEVSGREPYLYLWAFYALI